MRRCSSGFLPVARRLVTTVSWWDTVDHLAAHVVGGLVAADPALAAEMDAWIDDEDLWVARTALLHQLRFKGATDADRLFDHCLRRAGHPDFFVRKAIGWSLREYAKTAPAEVRAFVAAYGSRLSPSPSARPSRTSPRPPISPTAGPEWGHDTEDGAADGTGTGRGRHGRGRLGDRRAAGTPRRRHRPDGADLVVGSSAGAVVGARLGAIGLPELYERELGDEDVEPAARLGVPTLLRYAVAVLRSRTPEEYGRRIGRLALGARTVDGATRRETVVRRLGPATEWPGRPLLVTAVDAVTGELVAYGATDGVPRPTPSPRAAPSPASGPRPPSAGAV